MIWRHATTKAPCPICRKTDWCTFGDRAMLCQRVASEHPHDKGGWYHFYGEPNPEYVPREPRKAPPKRIDADTVMRRLRRETQPFHFNVLAQKLGVTNESLYCLGAAWHAELNAWAFPMYDTEGEIVGIRLRNKAGFKWTVTGSLTGVFMSIYEPDNVEYALLPEGPTDTAAAISMGYFALGRPTCTGGNDIIKATLRRLGIYKAVIVADNDEMKKLGPKEGRPGNEGAQKLKAELGLKSVIFTPPSPLKDIRELAGRGLERGRLIIEASIKNKIWSKQ